MKPFTLALLSPTKLTTVYFLPPTVRASAVALRALAARRKPCGIIQISSCCAHGVSLETMIVCDTGWSPTSGCWPPPRGGFSPCARTRSTFDAGFSKSIARVYFLLMNFGHGDAAFGAWPSAKSWPVAEYSTVFSASTPIAFEALAMAEPASCAEGLANKSAARPSAVRGRVRMMHRLSEAQHTPIRARRTPPRGALRAVPLQRAAKGRLLVEEDRGQRSAKPRRARRA